MPVRLGVQSVALPESHSPAVRCMQSKCVTVILWQCYWLEGSSVYDMISSVSYKLPA